MSLNVAAVKNRIALLPSYTKAILRGATSPQYAAALTEAEKQIYQNQQANPESKTARTAGAYFANENVLAGSMTSSGVAIANANGSREVPGWEDRSYKIKLGPGITFIEPASVYSDLLKEGTLNPELAVNYTAPFGTTKTRQGLADVMNARIVEEQAYSADEIIQTSGATEALELGLEAVSQLYPGSNVLSAGFSYYTAFFTADQKGLSCNRAMPEVGEGEEKTRFQPTAAEIAPFITESTKSLLLTLPNNPTGESYDIDSIKDILLLSKERNLLVLFDAIFEEMSLDEETQFSPVLNMAQELGMLESMIVIDSLSKRRGLAGARLGWLATKNQQVLSTLENTVLARRCNPALVYEPIAQFEGLASQLSKQVALFRGNAPQQRKFAQELLLQRGAPWSVDAFLSMYQQWDEWRTVSQDYYRQNFEIVQFALDGFAKAGSFTEGSFNTFVKLGENVSSSDFMAKLMLLTGTYTQVGPCFGISEKVWNEQLGLWARVSFATERKDLIEGITRMIALASAYQEFQLGDDSKYPALNISYDSQR